MLLYLKRWELAQKCVEDLSRFWHFPSQCVNAKIVLRDLYLFLKSKIGTINISITVRARAKMWRNLSQILTVAIEWRHCENCAPGSWPTCWRQNVNIAEAVKANATMQSTPFIDLDIFQRMIETIAKLTSNDVDLLFKVNN